MADSQSNATQNVGFKRGIRVGRAKDGKVTALIPFVEPDPDKHTNAGMEGVAADAMGNGYGGETTTQTLKKYVKKTRRALQPGRIAMGSSYLRIGGSITLSGTCTPMNSCGMRPTDIEGSVREADFAANGPPTSEEEPRDGGIIAKLATIRPERTDGEHPYYRGFIIAIVSHLRSSNEGGWPAFREAPVW